ncbi:secondary thiamine-phosphate synthase enzyme YjbQ [Pseudoalteromonas sp. T1lg65]|uniref:secondary thiamine-phosphate synthase enzyme YjbQ n=1 Tax=Pseudoalteromonas sp. T1lg65 TaxID=2077101 RepID=UPI003F7930D8
MSLWMQKEITLQAKSRGFHLITDEILIHLPEIKDISIGISNLFLQHTSASLTINENADPTVRQDFESYFSRSVAEGEPYYRHTYEGSDDLPAHIKSSLLGCSVSIPIKNGELAMGIWQGIYLGEHRNHGGARRIVVTLNGKAYG